MRYNFKKRNFMTSLSCVTALSSIAAASLSFDVHAQGEDVFDNKDDYLFDENDGFSVEALVVYGIRASLQASAGLKKSASIVVDSVTAEDIGKFPDENVAESLQRITGVQIDRSGLGGEGNKISVRGLPPEFSRAFLNGRPVLGTNADRQIDYRDLPSEFVSRLEVHKTPTAKQIEGSAGGSVETFTASPFDNDGSFNAVFSAKGEDNSLVEEWKPIVAAQISNTVNDKFGFLLGMQYRERVTREDRAAALDWECVDSSKNLTRGNGAASPPANEQLNVRCGTVGGVGVRPEDAVFRPRFVREDLHILTSERLGVNGVFEFLPSDKTTIKIDTLYTSRDASKSQNDFIMGLASQNGIVLTTDNARINDEGDTVVGVRIDNSPDITGQAQLRSAHRTDVDENMALISGINIEHRFDQLTLRGDFGISMAQGDIKTDQAQIFKRVFGEFSFDGPEGIPSYNRINWRTDVNDPSSLVRSFSNDPTDRTGWLINNWRNEAAKQRQDEKNLKLDLEYRVNNAFWIKQLDMGVRVADSHMSNESFGVFGNFTSENGNNPRPTVESQFPDPSLVLSTVGETRGVTNFGSKFPASALGDWVTPLIPSIRDFNLERTGKSLNAFDDIQYLKTFSVDESVNAVYAQVNFSNEEVVGAFSGNIGVRYVDTDVMVSGFFTGNADSAASIDSQYTNVLPSINLSLGIIPEALQLRFGAAKVLVRPNFGALQPGTNVNTTTFSGKSGNPKLQPFEASQADLSLEWYFGGSNVLSAAAFYKNIESFLKTDVIQQTVDESLLSGSDPGQIFSITQPTNGDGGTITGVELGYQHTFESGYGVLMNYTYIDSKTSIFNPIVQLEVGLEGLSKNSYNLTAFYEQYNWSIRAAYNYRDDYLTVTQGGGGTPVFGDAYGQLDVSAAYDFDDHWSFSLEMKNILDEATRFYDGRSQRLQEYKSFGSRIFVGARYRF